MIDRYDIKDVYACGVVDACHMEKCKDGDYIDIDDLKSLFQKPEEAERGKEYLCFLPGDCPWISEGFELKKVNHIKTIVDTDKLLELYKELKG